ncbi:alpha/beta fold hydrolase [Methyloferula stellata]|uniref:alpha/beta fold hydrolase n=1 Tax=Methyloferula stellata TaxID=876270 RepID=UPI00037B600F|nr:alpha/beta fold hydrolase [Methyloferula stellata]
MRKARVILAHGWLGHHYELAPIGDALESAGFEVKHVKLYTLFGRFEAAVDAVLEAVLAQPNRRVHLIGFSFGGLVMRAVADRCPSRIESLLLIGVPNTGSPFADLLSIIFPTSAVRRLARAAPSLPEPPLGLRVGCIAGTRKGLLGLFLRRPNDSRVTAASAFAIPHDFEATVHCKHEVLRGHPEVIRHAVAFVERSTGC